MSARHRSKGRRGNPYSISRCTWYTKGTEGYLQQFLSFAGHNTATKQAVPNQESLGGHYD